MFKLEKIILSQQKNIIGFVISGKEKDFGRFGDKVTEQNTHIKNMIQMKFSNNQISVTEKGGIIEKGSFKLTSLPILVHTGDKFIPLENGISLVKKYIFKNEIAGFKVRYSNGLEEQITYNNLLNISKIIKPINFMVRTTSGCKKYICGANGTKLDNIPSEIIGEKVTGEVPKKRLKSASKQMPEAVVRNEAEIDIIDIYNFLESVNGLVIKLPNEEYIAKTKGVVIENDGFTSLNIGEIATASPKFNSKKLNVNALFRQAGMLKVDISNGSIKVPTYLYKSKSIFSGGEHHIKNFGVAVKADRESDLINFLGKSLAVSKITNNMIIGPLAQIIDSSELVFYKVDTSKINIISRSKIEDSLLSAEEIAKVQREIFQYSLIDKVTSSKGGIIKDLKFKLNPDEMARLSKSKLFGAYSAYSQEAINAMKDAGINIYDGSYSPKITKETDRNKSSYKESSSSIEIEYSLAGYDISKVTGKEVIKEIMDCCMENKQPVNKHLQGINPNIAKIIYDMLNIKNPTEQYLKAIELSNEAEKEIYKLNKKMWLHNTAMYLKNNKAYVHHHDDNEWEVDTKTRVKTAMVYKSIKVPGLSIKIKGTSIG